MAIIIKSLGDGILNSSDLTNIFTTATDGKTALVRNIRFVNPSTQSPAWLTVAFVRTTGTPGQPGPARLLGPGPVYIEPKEMYALAEELALEYGGTGSSAISDAIQAKAVQSDGVTAIPIDYVISGIEREA